MGEKCKESVHDTGRGVGFHKCFNNAKKDGYCGIHHPDAVKRRREKNDALYAAQTKKWDEQWAKKAFNVRAGNRCRELGIQPEDICAPK